MSYEKLTEALATAALSGNFLNAGLTQAHASETAYVQSRYSQGVDMIPSTIFSDLKGTVDAALLALSLLEKSGK